MEKNNKYYRLFSDMAVFAVGNLFVKLIQFFLLPLYTSVLTTSEYGTAELLNNLAELLLPVLTLCIYEAVLRYAIDKSCDHAKLFSTATLLIGISSVALLFLAVLAQLLIHYEYIWYIVFVLLSSSFRTLFASYTRGVGHVKRFAISGVINVLTLLVVNIVLLVQLQMGIEGYLASLGIANVFSMLFLFFASGLYKVFRISQWDGTLIKPLLLFSVPMIFNGLFWWFINISGRYVVLWYCGISAAGLFAAASKLPAILNLATGIFQQAWQLTAAREYDSDSSERFFSRIYKLYSAGIILFGSIVICATPFIANIFLQNSFIEAQAFIPALMFVAVINSFQVFFVTFYNAYKQNTMIMVSTLLGAIVNVVFCLSLVSAIGIWGSICASFVSYLLIAIIRIVDTRKLVKINFEWKITLPCLTLLLLQVIIMSFQLQHAFALSVSILVCMILTMLVFYRKAIKRYFRL